MVLVLLPGMDGTEKLFRWFVEQLSSDVEAKIVSYPPDLRLPYEELANGIFNEIPLEKQYIIVAESYSGPMAVLLGGRAGRNLQAVVLVASFVRSSWSPAGVWLARFVMPGLFLLRPPRWLLRFLMLDSDSSDEVLRCLEGAIASVRPEVLAGRFQHSLKVDVSGTLARCAVRTVYVLPGKDRLLGQRGLRGVLAARPDTEVMSVAGPHLLFNAIQLALSPP
jgi:pimeloyl-[acyl-carrier protein] methyl ester esterase